MFKSISKEFILLILILEIGFISAEFSIGEPSHYVFTSYNNGNYLDGWINISFNQEPTNSLLNNSLGGGINLLNLLNKISNTNFKYNCTPKSCIGTYSATNGETEKVFQLDNGDSAIFGFNLTGERFTGISNFEFDLISNNPETGIVPISIDILNDGNEEWQAYNRSENYGLERFGCFEKTEVVDSASIAANIYYCEKITMQKTPQAEIGAYVKGNGNEVNLTMKIENENRAFSKSCTTKVQFEGEGRIACVVDTSNIIKSDGRYYVCIKATSSKDSGYEIDYEQTNTCGLSNDVEGYDFYIFGRSKKYSSDTKAHINDTEIKNSGGSVSSIENYIEDYISDVYGNDCKAGCIIPVRLNSNVTQQIGIYNAEISYVVGISKTTDKIFDLLESPATITTSEFQQLYLTDAGFNIDNLEEGEEISVFLRGEKLFSESLNLESAPTMYISPLITAVNYPTVFSVRISGVNATKYYWNFGDGKIQTTTTKQVSHTYNETGNYSLSLKVQDITGREYSKGFSVIVSLASVMVPKILADYSNNLQRLENSLSQFSTFEQQTIKDAINFEEVKEEISLLNKNAAAARTEEDYNNIIESLSELKIPSYVGKTLFGKNIIFYPKEKNINLNLLEEIGGGNFTLEKEEKYKEAISSFVSRNLNIVLNFSEFSALYSDYKEPLVKIFQVDIQNKGTKPVYIVVEDGENIITKGDIFTKTEDYQYARLEGGEKQYLVFSTTEDFGFLDFPMFVSPSLKDITLAEWSEFDTTETTKKWVIFGVIVGGMIFLTFLVYIVLQMWYKRKYENYLFKDRNNLYNLVNYIKSAKDKGTKNNEIEKNLEKVGWSSEQIRYAMRKFENKNTGMPEIKLPKIKINNNFKIIKKKKTK